MTDAAYRFSPVFVTLSGSPEAKSEQSADAPNHVSQTAVPIRVAIMAHEAQKAAVVAILAASCDALSSQLLPSGSGTGMGRFQRRGSSRGSSLQK